MEAAVRWSPHSTDDRRRFLLLDIADQSLALHHVDALSKTHISHHRIAYSPKVPSFSAFDWSKSQESIVALGHVSGTASLIKLYSDDNDCGGQASETVAAFRLKQQRKCNSIAFSTQDWLAIGVDKTRSDVCLFVYDVNRDQLAEPVRRLCAAEVVSSVSFFAGQPETLVASTSRAFVRVYDLRDASFNVGGSAQASTKCVNNIAIDPLDENYFASAGSTDDPSVTVWDRRWMSQTAAVGSSSGAVFDFRPAVSNTSRTTVWSLRYSGQRRGRLALCSNTGELKVIDMREGHVLNNHAHDWMNAESYGSGGSGGQQWTNPSYSGEEKVNQPYVSEERIIEQACRDPKLADKRIIAFDWVSDDLDASSQRMLALNPGREVDVLTVPSARVHAELTRRNDLSIALEEVSTTEPRHYVERQVAKAPYEQPNRVEPEDFGPLEYTGDSDSLSSKDDLIRSLSAPKLQRLLASSTLYRDRCLRGYLFDCPRNAHIVAGNWQLERLWEIIERFRSQAADAGMTHLKSNLDLSYIGVSGLWTETIPNLPARRPVSNTNKAAKPRDAIVGLNKSHHLPAFEGERTAFPEQRQLCLLLCGWKFTPDTLETECNELIERGLYYQAIVQAVLHGYTHIALNLLRSLIRSKTIPNIGLGALLASDSINADQREMCLWMAADTEDAALKALLAYLVSGDWRDVMKTPYLHLGYRLALGLKYLNDTELSGFLASETARAVRNGDLEGILLTGLAGEPAMDLFQTYVVRTGDVQTAVLATGFTDPRYGNDVRWEVWKETYFEQMQRWGCFAHRAKFTVQHAKMARDVRTGEAKTEVPPKQMALRCAHCQGSVARDSASAGSRAKRGSVAATERDKEGAVKVAGPAAHAGTVCLRCGRHLPRCAICHLWLGTPEPQRPSRGTPSRKASQSKGVNGDTEGKVDGDAGEADGEKEGDVEEKLVEKMRHLLTFCGRCGHGYHAHHARMWFGRQRVCAVGGCGCLCQT